MGKTTNTLTQSQLIKAIKANDTVVLQQIYVANYPKVEALIIKNSGSVAYAKDIYQDAFLTVWQNIKQDKFVPTTQSSISGYLYRVCKNKWIDVLRSKGFKNTIATSQLPYFQIPEDENNGIDDDILKEQRLQDVMYAFKSLGEACKNLLNKFYFEKKSMTAIAKELGLDAASTRNKKYRCMQKLRQLALKNK